MDELIDTARAAQKPSYAPYSTYHVGAAIRTTDGSVYTGSNVENMNYSNSLHAEELAIGTAVTDGYTSFDTLAVSSSERDGITPCGMCRQTLWEFCGDQFQILCDEGDQITEYRLGDLLPAAMQPAMLNQ